MRELSCQGHYTSITHVLCSTPKQRGDSRLWQIGSSARNHTIESYHWLHSGFRCILTRCIGNFTIHTHLVVQGSSVSQKLSKSTLYYTTQDNSSDSSGLERFRGAISSLSLFSFLKTRVMETFLKLAWKYKMTCPTSYDGNTREKHFLYCVSCIWSVSILFPLIPWNSLFGRAAMWVAQGLRPPHAFTLCALNHDCSKPH